MTLEKRSFAIVGGGIAGLACATLLQRQGHRIFLFDKAPSPQPVGSGLILQPSSLPVLNKLGVYKALLSKGQKLERLFGLVEPAGRVVLDVAYKAMNKNNFGLGIQRDALYQALLSKAQTEGVEVCFNCAVTGVSERVSGAYVEFQNRNSDGPFDLIIDCLGAQSCLSPVRKKPLAFGALWANVPAPREPWFKPMALEQRYVRAEKMAGLLPTGQSGAAFFWSLRRNEYEKWRAAPFDQWKSEVVRLWPQLETTLSSLHDHDDLIMAHYYHRTNLNPIDGAVLHLGDSWHAASPQLGQGANMALIDAGVLDACLSCTASLNDAMALFFKTRRAHIFAYQLISWSFTPLYQSTNRLMSLMRDYLAAPLSRLPIMQSLLSQMVSGSLCAQSSLAMIARDEAAQADGYSLEV